MTLEYKVASPSSCKKQSPLPVEDIVKHCQNYKGANTKRSIIQLLVTLTLFTLSCSLMAYSLKSSYLWITAILLLPTAGLLTRIFIFQHDCGHGSFFKTKKANDYVGRFLGLLTVTPYDFWRRAHNMHHATSGDLDRRSIGGIDTITVSEYKSLPRWKKFTYRMYRNPVIMLLLGTPLYTIIIQRIPFSTQKSFHEDYKTLPLSSIWKSIMMTNIMLAVFFGSMAYLVGWQTLALVYLPVLFVASCIGGWLFYIQHQFEDTYWENHQNWNIHEAALMGSTYYKLPAILQWFTGNIGLHHIHHLCLKIPNYKLQECMDEWQGTELENVSRLSLRESLGCLRLKLWDEDKNKLVPFSAL